MATPVVCTSLALGARLSLRSLFRRSVGRAVDMVSIEKNFDQAQAAANTVRAFEITHIAFFSTRRNFSKSWVTNGVFNQFESRTASVPRSLRKNDVFLYLLGDSANARYFVNKTSSTRVELHRTNSIEANAWWSLVAGRWSLFLVLSDRPFFVLINN